MRISDWSSDVCSSDRSGRDTRTRDDQLTLLTRYSVRSVLTNDLDLGEDQTGATGGGVLPEVLGQRVRGDAAWLGQPSMEERRVGNERVSTWRSRWWPYN